MSLLTVATYRPYHKSMSAKGGTDGMWLSLVQSVTMDKPANDPQRCSVCGVVDTAFVATQVPIHTRCAAQHLVDRPSMRSFQKLVRNGKSTQVTILQPFLRRLGWKTGSIVVVQIMDTTHLVVRPPTERDFSPIEPSRNPLSA